MIYDRRTNADKAQDFRDHVHSCESCTVRTFTIDNPTPKRWVADADRDDLCHVGWSLYVSPEYMRQATQSGTRNPNQPVSNETILREMGFKPLFA